MKAVRQYDISSFKSLPKTKNISLNSHQHRRFNFIFLTAALLPIMSAGFLNFIVDPYGFFNSPIWLGFNQAKPEKFKQDMLINAVEVIQKKPEIIFLGSSRVQWGLKTNHPGLENNKVVYNLALQGTNLYQIRQYFEHALSNQPNLKQVVIGLDELMFSEFLPNRPDFNQARLGKQHITFKDFTNVVFSIDALSASGRTIKVSLAQPDAVSVGSFKVKPQIFDHGSLALDNSSYPGSSDRFINNLKTRLNPNRADGRYSNYQLSKDRLADLKAIVDTCNREEIDLKLFISPEHATLFEAMNSTRFGPEIEAWKQEIVKIKPVWDFSGYNSITTEPIGSQMKYYLDSSHYNQKTGELILNRLLSYQTNQVPADFGVLITPQNVESHLAKVHSDRQAWAKKNPDLVKLIQNIRS